MNNNVENNLIGKSFSHKWTKGKFEGVSYNVEFISDQELKWLGLEGFPKGKSDTERYELSIIAEEIYQFSWLSDDGMSVLLTYNLKEKKAFGVISKEEEKFILEGFIQS